MKDLRPKAIDESLGDVRKMKTNVIVEEHNKNHV